jgi:hypothetical protein
MMFLARFWRRLHTPVFGFSGVALGCLSQFCIPCGRSWLQRALGPTRIMSIIVDPLQGLAVLPRRGASRSDEWGILSGELATKPLKHGIFIGGLQFQACRSINDRRCLLLLRPPPRARYGLTVFIQHEEDCLRGRTLRGGVVVAGCRHWTRTGFRPAGQLSRDAGKFYSGFGQLVAETASLSWNVDWRDVIARARCHESNRDDRCSKRSESSRPYAGIRGLSTLTANRQILLTADPRRPPTDTSS